MCFIIIIIIIINSISLVCRNEANQLFGNCDLISDVIGCEGEVNVTKVFCTDCITLYYKNTEGICNDCRTADIATKGGCLALENVTFCYDINGSEEMIECNECAVGYSLISDVCEQD
eukprot:Pgem_evm1s11652